MPKPEDSYTWDNNSTNEAVPTSNHEDDGYAANEIPSSGEFNHKSRINGEVSRWIAEGSSGGEETAHLVETDVDGASAIAVLTVGPPTPAGAALTVAGSAAGGVALVAVGTASSPAVSALGGGDAALVAEGQDGASGVSATGSDLGHGVVGMGGEGGNGVVGTPGSGGDGGVVGYGVGSTPGVRGEGDTTGNGVLGLTDNTGGYGVLGQSDASATTSGAGVVGQGLGSATGVIGTAANGYGVIAISDTSSPARAALRLGPQNADPTTLADGDMWSSSDRNDLRIRANGQSKTVHATPMGYVDGVSSVSSATNNNSAAYTTIATATLTGQLTPQSTGTVMITATAEFGAAGGTLHTSFDLQIVDTTAAATVWSQTILHPAAAAGSTYDRSWSFQTPYSLPASGTRSFELQFRRAGAGGTGIQARDAVLAVRGRY